jgi:hypothetical protein
VKQTKPFGMAYSPTPTPQPADTQGKAAEPAIESSSAASAANAVELFSLRASDLPGAPTKPVDPLKKLLRDTSVAAITLPLLFMAFVAMRDSMVLAKMLEKMTTAETVMVCEDGKMIYADFSVSDRLMNRGNFMCTDWRMQNGYLSIPKR